MKVLVVGADSAIGSALVAALTRRRHIVHGTTRRRATSDGTRWPVDLASPDVVGMRLPSVDVAVFCAAIASFAECRQNRALARRVNVTAPAALARRLVAVGGRVVLLSTSAVFDWRTPHVLATRPPCPVSAYGELKAEAEAEFATLGTAASILRFRKVLTPQLKLFTGWVETLGRGGEVTAISDLRMAPVGIDDAVAAILAVLDDAAGGIYQLSGEQDISYADAALHLAGRLGVPAERVLARRAIDAGILPEEITHFSTLDSSRLADITGLALRDPFSVIDAVYGPAIDAARDQRGAKG